MSISVQQAGIESLYVGYFNRSSEPAGLAYWVGRLDDGMSLVAIAQSFSVQAEATSLYPYLVSAGAGGAPAFLSAVYANVFNRAIDGEGQAYWMAELSSRESVGRVILDMISGARGNDRLPVNNKATVGVEYAQAFENAHKA